MNKIIVEEKFNLTRADAFLIDKINVSRSKVQKMIKEAKVLVNGESIKNSYRVKTNDEITFEDYVEEQMEANPEDIKLNIVYEDDDLMVVNKPSGMVVHPALSHNTGTLVNALLYYSKNLSDINGEFRPGIVHRIDAYTSGLLMVAKNNNAHVKLQEQLKAKTTHRVYSALVWGRLKSDTATIDAPIGRSSSDRKKMTTTNINSKIAVTHINVIERLKEVSLIEATLETGRTHQIRVHLDYIGHPVVNDPSYGRRTTIDKTGQCLHAKELGFVHPTTNEYMEFTSELPKEFVEILNKFEKE